MKTIKSLTLFIALLVISVISNAQFHIGAGAGYSSKQAVISEFSMGYDFNVVDVEIGLLSHWSTAVDKGTIFNVKLGHTIEITDKISIRPSLGYANMYKSSDNKSLNTRSAIYSVYLYKDMPMKAQLFAGVNYADRALIGSIGLRLSLRNE